MTPADLFDVVDATPGFRSLVERAGNRGSITVGGAAAASHPFITALLSRRCSGRPVVFVTHSLKAQELAHADLTTWLNVARHRETADKDRRLSIAPRFFPAWDVLPHENRLPHPDIIS